MPPELAAIAVKQHGLVTRAQCRRAGFRDPAIRDLTAVHGPWVVVRRGVYVDRAIWEAADHDARWALRDLAAHLTMHLPHVMSHDTAARAMGIPLLRPKHELTHVTRRGVQGSRTSYGVKHHLTRVEMTGLVDAGLMRLTSPARTGLDLAREHGFRTGVGAIDHVLRGGTRKQELERELEVMTCWPGIRRARQALNFSDGRAESLAESLGRCLLAEAGFTNLDVQWPIFAKGSLFWVDLRIGCHVVEIDGLGKYLPREAGGLADRSTRQVLREERQRQAAICAEGLGMSRLVWDDLIGRAREDAIRRVRAEEAVTRARFGSELPTHLVEQAARIRREHRRFM